jgi:TolA-binding protein
MASIAAAGAVGAGVYYGVSDSGSYDEERPVIAVQATNRAPAQGEAPPVRQVRERGAQGAETKVADSEASAQEAEHQTVQSRARKATKQRTTGKSTDGATLGEELALVESASRATKAGNARLALERLAEYQRKFPRGKLALEAQVIRIEALARAGRRAEASRLARSFLKRHPKSPIGARISRYAE